MFWLKYTTRETPYTQQQNINLDRFSNGLTVKNAGNTILFINADPLQPGESKAFGGNKGEILDGRYRIYFELPTPAPPIPANLAIVTEKFYLPTPEQKKDFPF